MEEFDERCGSDFHHEHLLLTNRNRFIDSLQRPPADNRVARSRAWRRITIFSDAKRFVITARWNHVSDTLIIR